MGFKNISKYVNINISVTANQIDENKFENIAIIDINIYFVNNFESSRVFEPEFANNFLIGFTNKKSDNNEHIISNKVGIKINLYIFCIFFIVYNMF